MAEKKKDPPAPIEFPAVEIKFKDLFSFSELYTIMFIWLKNEGWKDKVTGDDVEFMEELYLEKTGATGAKDHMIYWEIEKPISGDFFKYSMSISIKTTYLNPTELMLNGKKVKADIGEVGIKIVARLHPDYKAKWVNNPLLGSFYGWMETTVFKNEFAVHKAKVYKQLYGFQAEIKRYLKLKQFMSGKEEGFMPEKQV